MRIHDKILLIGAALVCAIGFAGTALFPAGRFSVQENRYLAPFPQLSAAGVLDGSVSAGLESFASERFAWRAPLRTLWGGALLALGQREAHGVILCRDGSLSRRLPTDAAMYGKNLAAMRHLQGAAQVPLTLFILPRRIEARSEVLPLGYDTSAEEEDLAALPSQVLFFSDCRGDGCWFRTDHHWTQQGAYHAYVRLGEELGYTPLAESAFEIEVASDGFFGSSYAAAGLPLISPDNLELWHYAGEEALQVLRNGEPADFRGLYDRARLQTSDKYAVFLGGNCGTLEITQGEQDTRPTLLVIKDSFGNALLPFLARHFRIVALDPRYTPLSLSKPFEGADKALLLCGIQTLTQGPFLSLMRP